MAMKLPGHARRQAKAARALADQRLDARVFLHRHDSIERDPSSGDTGVGPRPHVSPQRLDALLLMQRLDDHKADANKGRRDIFHEAKDAHREGQDG